MWEQNFVDFYHISILLESALLIRYKIFWEFPKYFGNRTLDVLAKATEMILKGTPKQFCNTQEIFWYICCLVMVIKNQNILVPVSIWFYKIKNYWNYTKIFLLKPKPLVWESQVERNVHRWRSCVRCIFSRNQSDFMQQFFTYVLYHR